MHPIAATICVQATNALPSTRYNGHNIFSMEDVKGAAGGSGAVLHNKQESVRCKAQDISVVKRKIQEIGEATKTETSERGHSKPLWQQ